MPPSKMVPIWPELIPADPAACRDALCVIGFGDLPVAPTLSIPVRQLGAAPIAEVWQSSQPVTRGRVGEVSFACNGDVLLGMTAEAAGETEILTSRLYEQIVSAARLAGYPHLLRVWNHVGAINEPERELERYQRFCTGRHDALTRLGFGRHQFPAACAVGMANDGVSVYFLASRQPGIQVENPRQVSAYQYPPQYGPRSPSFARASVAQWNGSALIFLAGTSSVVGHETVHSGDVRAQLDETLRNVDTIVGEAAARIGHRATLEDLATAKIYLRHAADYGTVAARVTAALPRTQTLFLESDICRKDLLIEIEGVAKL